MKLEPNSTLLTIGASVTDCGRARPVGVGAPEALGNGYVSLVAATLTCRYPERNLRVMNMGVSGNTTRDLAARWDTDVLELKPQALSILIGTNDVWRKFDGIDVRQHVPANEYQQNLTRLVERSRPLIKTIVLMTAFFVETNAADPMRRMMDQYGGIMKTVAAEQNLPCVDTQAAFDELLKYMPYTALAGDRVHPNLTGHMALARGLLAALECPVT